MKKLLLYINVMFLFATPTYSQTLSDSMMYSIIGQYVEERADTSVTQKIYIDVNNKELLVNFSVGKTKIIFFDSKKIRRYYKTLTNSNGMFHTLSIRHSNDDTIDFCFTKCQVKKEGKYYGTLMESGGDLGYIPYARFIYSKEEKKWRLIPYDELKKNAIQNLPNVFNNGSVIIHPKNQTTTQNKSPYFLAR